MTILRVLTLAVSLFCAALPAFAEEVAHGLPRSQNQVEIVILSDTDAARANAAKIIDLYDLLVTQGTPQAAADRHVDQGYIQHNPMLADGPQALADLFAYSQSLFPQQGVVIHKIIAAGDQVWAHVNFYNLDNDDPNDRGVAVVDMYRFGENGLLIEHWDVIQAIPDPADAANSNGMF